MKFPRSAVILFAFYAALFSALLLFVQVAYSPISGNSPSQSENIEASDLHFDMTSSGLTAREQVIQRLESAPEKPPYEIILRATSDRAPALKKLLESTLASSFISERVTPISVEMVDNRTEPRGQTSNAGVSIIATIPSDSEFLKVFVHELGHVVDLHFLMKKTFSSDPSDEFYAISWIDYNQKKKGMNVDDFVSGYALTNKYEDFAESFAFYVFHNDEFKRRASKNASLARKYNFLADNVFASAEFQGTSFEAKSVPSYIWDTTKVAIKTNKYLFYLR